MLTRMQTVVETESNPIETWIRKLWPQKTDSQPASLNKWSGRESYRLVLEQLRTIQIEVATLEGTCFKSIVYDLSAGGLSCTAPLPENLVKNKRVRVRFRLPLEEETVTIETDAFYQKEELTDTGKKIGRFRFARSLKEEDQDSIHQFILKEQFEGIQRRKREEVYY